MEGEVREGRGRGAGKGRRKKGKAKGRRGEKGRNRGKGGGRETRHTNPNLLQAPLVGGGSGGERLGLVSSRHLPSPRRDREVGFTSRDETETRRL